MCAKKTFMAPYEFRVLDWENYEVELIFTFKNNLIKSVFSKSRRLIKAKTGIEVTQGPNELEKFEVPPRFYHLLRTAANSHFKDICRQVKEIDHKLLISDKVTKAFYNKKDNEWEAHIVIGGIYGAA